MTAHIFIFHSIMFKVNIFRSRRHVNVDGFIINPHPSGSLEDSILKYIGVFLGEDKDEMFYNLQIILKIVGDKNNNHYLCSP